MLNHSKKASSNKFLYVVTLIIGASSLQAFADTTLTNAPASTNGSWMPHTGRVLASGAAVSNVRTIGGDGMLPIYGQSDAFIFADFMGDYANDSTYLVSPGLGYRKVLNNQIVGGYLFGDYERTSLGTNFWVISPGIEWMNTHWDAHVNAYFPTETSEQSGAVDFASNYGVNDYVKFETGTHNQYDEMVTPYAVIGDGVDAEIGYGFAEIGGLRSRVYLGGYFYAPPSADDVVPGYDNVENITGVTAGFEQPLSKNLKLAIFNSYDNVNDYAVGVSLTATFGQDSTVFSNNIHDRLLDPIERHVGIIDTGAGTYDQESFQENTMSLQYDNVYFLEPETSSPGYDDSLLTNTTSDIGTYGNPAHLTQATLDAIDAESPDGARIYLQGGTDGIYQINSSTAPDSTPDRYGDHGLLVYNGQDFYGRTADYTAPADANAQPNIEIDSANNYSGFIILDGENTFSDITMYGDGTPTGRSAGFNVFNNSTLSLSHINVSGMGSGISSENNANDTLTIEVSDSTISNNYGNAISVLNNFWGGTTGNAVLNISNSQINDNVASGIAAQNSADGLFLMNIDNTVMDGNTQSALSASNNTRSLGTGLGVFTINVTNSTMNANGIPNSAANVSLESNTAGTLTFSATNTTFNDGNNGIDVNNNGSTGSIINISDLSGSTINNNNFYGISASATQAGSTTTINYTGATIEGNLVPLVDNSSGGVVTWIPEGP